MKDSIVLNIKEKKKKIYSKEFYVTVFIMLFPFTMIYNIVLTSSIIDSISRNIKKANTREVLGTNKEEIFDQEVMGGYLDEIRDYTDNIYDNLVLVDATYYLMENISIESTKYAQILNDNMGKCSFSSYPYNKGSIISDKLLNMVNMLEEYTNEFCSVVAESSSIAIEYYNTNDTEKKYELFKEMYVLDSEAYDRGTLIYDICDDIYNMIGR